MPEYPDQHLIDELFQALNGQETRNGHHKQTVSSLSDDQVIGLCRKAKNAPKFASLFDDGDREAHDGKDRTPSAADYALITILRFWTQDPEQLERLMRRSALRRPEWEENRTGKTWIRYSIDRALSPEKEFETYQPDDGAHVENKSSAYKDAVADDLFSKFKTAKQCAEETGPKTKWLVEGYLAKGAITEVDGKIKAAGKTTWVTHKIRCLLEGKPFMGKPTTQTKAVILTEQAPSSFRQVLKRAGLEDREDLLVLYWKDVTGVPWEDIANAAKEKALEFGAGALFVDTLGQFSGLKGDAENNSGAALEAVKPLQEAAASGLAVELTRHERKSGGDVGDSARGSSAFGGAVDIIVSIRRGEGGTRPTVRILESLSRFDETPDKLVIELTGDGYVSRGDVEAFAEQEAKQVVLEVLPTKEEHALSTNDVVDKVKAKRELGRTVITTTLAKLTEAGQIVRLGTGKRGNPYKYYEPLEAPEPEPPKGAENNSSATTPYTRTINSVYGDEVLVQEGWTPEEIDLRRRILSGGTVRLDMHKQGPHARFRQWAEEHGLTLYIGRKIYSQGLEESDWHNPFKVDVDGTREEVVRRFEEERLPWLLSRGKDPEEYRGKALGCWCKPDELCHGDVLIDHHHDHADDGGFTYVTTLDQLTEAISKLSEAEQVGLDLETIGTDPATGSLRLVQVSDGENTFVVDATRVDPKPLLEHVAGKEIICHNALFELSWLKEKFDIEPETVHDTMLMSQVVHAGRIPPHNHSLAEVAKRELGLELDKSEQQSDWSAEKLSEEQIRYAATDARILPELYQELSTKALRQEAAKGD